MRACLNSIHRIVLIAVVALVTAGTAGATPSPVACDLDGSGSYVYDSAAHVDYYDWAGEIDQCAESGGLSESGSFSAKGFVAVEGASGSGSMIIVWEDGRRSVVEFVVTGIPELLLMAGHVAEGPYAGNRVTIEMHCKLKDTGACLTPGSSSWDFLGTLVIER